MKRLDEVFETEIINNASRANLECGCKQPKLLKLIGDIGAVKAVKLMIAKGQIIDADNELKKCNHLDLSIAASVVNAKFSELFTDEEVDLCLEQLLELGFYC